MIKIPDFVYPKDEEGNALCPRCRKTVAVCDCPSGEKPVLRSPRVLPKIRLDRSGRRGKCVTLIEGLPADEAYLKDKAKALKIKTGSGGTSYIDGTGGVIELQGDHCRLAQDFFK